MRRLAAQRVVIPAVTFAVQARLAEAQLTEIEAFALEAIGLGVRRLAYLTQLFGLGDRPTLDLIYELWRAGHLMISSEQHEVRLAGKAALYFKEGRLRELDSAERVVRPVNLIQELVTGAVLPWVGDTRPEGPDSALVPAVLSGLDLSRISRAALEEAVERQLVRERKLAPPETRQRDKLRVLEIWPAVDQLLQTQTLDLPAVRTRRFLNALADVRLDPDTGTLGFELVHAPDVPATVRRALSAALTRRAVPDAPLTFYKRLREGLEEGGGAAPAGEASDAITRLVAEAAQLVQVDPGVVAQRHDQLRAAYLDAIDALEARERGSARATLMVGHAAHDAALRALAGAAQRQLILANPWISLNGLIEDVRGESWFDVLRAALGRGVRVVLLWGIAEDATLPGQVRSALDDLRAEFPGLLLCSTSSSHVHAKVLVQDAEEAIVTSYNFLQPPRSGEPLELGLRVSGTIEGCCTAAVQSLLDWARERYPDARDRRQISTIPEDLGARIPVPSPVPEEPDLPALDAAGADPLLRALAVQLWAEQWRQVAQRFSSRADALGEGVSLVQGVAHRDVLWGALRDATRRLAVVSDRVSVDVVTDRFVRALRSRVDADVPCSLLFRREGAADTDDGPAVRLTAEAERAPERCRVSSARSHAKLIVCDDSLILGSYNFLSYGAEEGAGGRADRVELSLRVQDAALVDQVLRVLDEQAPGVFKPLTGRESGARSQALQGLPTSLQPLLRALHAQTPGAPEVYRWFQRSSTPWSDLDALERAGAGPSLLERAAWGAFAVTPLKDPASRARWRSKAALLRWSQGDLVGAALLLPASDRSSTLPAWLARLGAAVQGRLAEDLHLDVPSSPDEAAAALALTMVSVLLDARWDMLELLRLHEVMLPDVLRGWPLALEVYRRKGGGVPLDLRVIQRQAEAATWQQDVQAARAALREALEPAIHVGFTFPIGKHTWDVLRRPGRLLGELEAAEHDADADRLRAWLDERDRREETPMSLMDAASHEVHDAHNHRIEEPKRTVCVQRLERAWSAARRWVQLAGQTVTPPEEGRILANARPLARALEALSSPDLLAESVLAAPALAIARGRLRPLLQMERL